MLASVLKRYPSLKADDINIQDDGNGPFISKWNSDDPKPTSEELLLWEAEDEKLPKPPSESDALKKQQADLVFELMVKGVL